MDSNWDSSSFEAGTLECLLCRETLEYVNCDRSGIISHLKTVHQTQIHHNLILAITFLDNKTLNNIISEFEKHTKSVGDQIAEIFGIDATDEGLLEEVDADQSIVEIIDENAVEVILDEDNGRREIKYEDLDEDNGGKELKYEDIITSSEYFKKNPKQMTTKCNLDLHSGDMFPLVDSNLPSGWKVRDHKKQGGSLEKHFLAPDGRVIKSKRAVIEYLKIMEKYSVKNIITVARNREEEPSIEITPRDDIKREVYSNHQKMKTSKRKRKSAEGDDAKKTRRSGVGTECPKCHKVVGSLDRHMADMHSPPGNFPCRGCDKVFPNKNTESSHYSRNCKNRVRK